MALRLSGQTSGYVELEAPAVAGDNTVTLPTSNGAANQVLKNGATAGQLEYGLTLPSGSGSAHQVLKNSATPGTLEYGVALPSGNGTSGQYLQTAGDGTTSWQTVSASNLTQVSSQSLSGVGSVTFTGIPSTARVIYLVLDQASADNTTGGFLHIRLGDSGGIQTTGYLSNGAYINTASAADSFGSTTGFNLDNNDRGNQHSGVITIVNQSGNVWCSSGTTTVNNSGFMNAGRKELSGTLTQVQFLTTAGTFDNGTASLLYEVE